MKLPIPRDAFLLALSQAARVLGPGLAMIILAAFVELRVSAFRAAQQEKQVFPLILIANAAFIVAALMPGFGPWEIGLIWAMARGFQVAVLTIRARKAFPTSSATSPNTAETLPFIAPQSAGVFYAHLDTLMVRAFLGEAAAGLYNAALRLLQLANMVAQSLSQWFQPRLADVPLDSDGWLRQRLLLRVCLGVVAAGGLIAFTVLGEFIIGVLYGPTYADAAPILIIAGLVLVARCFVASQWMELTARQLEGHRARYSWLLLALFIALAWPLATQQGGSGVMIAHLLALGPIAAFSARSLVRATLPSNHE